MVPKWKILNRKNLFSGSFFDFVSERVETLSGKIMENYYRIETGDWVQVVALDTQSKMICVEQYRHGAKVNLIEVPGGAVDAGEDPLLACKRELLEETGYESNSWTKIFESYPNPALQNNTLHSYLALNCKKTSAQSLDPFEDIEVLCLSKKELEEALENNRFGNSLACMTVFKYLLGEENGSF